MHIQTCSLPCTIIHAIARWPKARSGGQDLKVHQDIGQCICAGFPKSNKANSNGPQNCFLHHIIRPILPSTHLFYFVYLIVLLFLFHLLTNQKNSFLYKIKSQKYFLYLIKFLFLFLLINTN